MKKFLNILSIVAVLLAVISLFFVSSISHLGIIPYSYSGGTLIYVSEVSPEDLVQGDKVIYLLGEDSGTAIGTVQQVDLTKGLFFIDEAELSYGDSDSEGKLVPFDIASIVGKQVFKIPLLGYLVDFLSTKTGFATFLGVIAALIIIAFLTTPPAKVKESKNPDGIIRGRRTGIPPKTDEDTTSDSNK